MNKMIGNISLFCHMYIGTDVGFCFYVFHVHYNVFTPSGRGIQYKSGHFQAWRVSLLLMCSGCVQEPAAEVLLPYFLELLWSSTCIFFFSFVCPLKKKLKLFRDFAKHFSC